MAEFDMSEAMQTMFGGDEFQDDYEENQRAEEGYLQALHRIMNWEEDVEEDPTNEIETLNLSGLGLKTLPPLPHVRQRVRQVHRRGAPLALQRVRARQ